jgi:hypothetical protein
MAISFLDDITLNNLQLQNVVLQKLGSDPTGVEGKIIYNTGTNTVKYYNGSSWIELDGLGGISGSGTVGKVPIFVTNTTTLGNSQLETSGSGSTQLFTFNTQGTTSFKGDVEMAGDLSLDSISGGGGLKDKDGDLGTSGQLLSSTGSATNWINAPVSYTKWVLTGDTGTQDIGDNNTVLVAGGSNITTAVTATDTVTVNLDSSINIGTLTVSDTAQSSFAGQVTIPTTPSANTDAASKAYVDASTVGNLIFQGGYDAAQNEPDLDSNPSSSIKKGWSYVVTVAGTFFTETVEVGDFLIAKQDAPTTLANWVTVQNNVGLATASTVGIGNVANSTANNNEGLSLSYSNGTATVGFNIKNNLSAASVLANDDQIAIFQGSTGSQGNKSLNAQLIPPYVSSLNSFAGTSSSATTHTFNHNLNTFQVQVQLYDTSSKETVYASVDRTSVNQVVATTASAASLTALIQKIG